MSDRRCLCGGRARAYERMRGAFGISLGQRFRCDDCGTRFDVVSPLGAALMSAVGLALLLGVWLSPASRFASADDRAIILVLVSALGLGLVGVAVHGLRVGASRPPWE